MNYIMMKMLDEAGERRTQNAWLKEYTEAVEEARREQAEKRKKLVEEFMRRFPDGFGFREVNFHNHDDVEVYPEDIVDLLMLNEAKR